MEQLKNFLPLIIFVGAYVAADIYVATAALMIAVTLQVAVYLLLKQPISMELKITFWVGLVMGTLTLVFRNELFIQWKTTVVNWLMATVLIGTHFFGKSYGVEFVLKKALQNAASADTSTPEDSLPKQAEGSQPKQAEGSQPKQAEGSQPKQAEVATNRRVWRTLNLLWIGSFALAGALNLIVAYNFSLDFWVTYKLVGGFVLTFTTIVITMAYLYRQGMLDHLESPSSDDAPAGSAAAAPTTHQENL